MSISNDPSALRTKAPEVHFTTAATVPVDRVEATLDRVASQLLQKASGMPDLSPLAKRTAEYLGTEAEFKALAARLEKALKLGFARAGLDAELSRTTTSGGNYVGASNAAIVMARAKAVIALNAFMTEAPPIEGGPAF